MLFQVHHPKDYSVRILRGKFTKELLNIVFSRLISLIDVLLYRKELNKILVLIEKYTTAMKLSSEKSRF
jgi:hypothetical protein